ncbi:glycosyltransferase family 2 protein [Psychroserpens algicola]|uniref:Glycosyltransferase family 2 protein n=1 Tax=Psychroserpens algicola TaxID=1719034 RepID=A0ABT0H6Y4_9FLAO|nr:glycosyltransferase family 2 protein [Psychroserpens algicola]MCK8480120.1 glycosyltransferase family 2 protein [Psychroserpens algicola]
MAMISVLIPVYNYDVTELVKRVHKQLDLCGIAFEIRCLDDASDFEFQKQKQIVEALTHTTYTISENNQGRITTRQKLAESALYEHLLFLDADVIPKNDTFIANYLEFINSKYDAVYGGVAYSSEKPGNDYLLRWTYGKQKEEVAAAKRNETPYKSIVSANFLIEASIFKRLNNKITYSGYGSDNHFSAQLKDESISVLHIDNYVYHLGIETSSIYLNKKEAAANALIALYNTQNTANHDNHLLKLFAKLKRLRLNYVLSWFYQISHNLLKQNLLGPKPSVNYLQLYRISYMCYQDLKKGY